MFTYLLNFIGIHNLSFNIVYFYTLAGWDRRGNEATLVAKWRRARSVVSH